MRRVLLSAVLLIVVLSGCAGDIVGGLPGSDPADSDVEDQPFELKRFTCDAEQTSPELPLRRLTRRQYVNVVNELLARSGLAPSDRDAISSVLRDELGPFPEDRVVGLPSEKHGGFSRLDQALQQGHVDTSYAVANTLGRELTSTVTRRRALLGACGTDTNTANDAQCQRDFITRFGRLVHRRPLAPEDVTFYASVTGPAVDPGVITDIVGLMLTSPQFLYHFEEGDPGASTAAPLDAYALANRLSFHFWQTMPDDALLTAAENGSLLTEATYQAQVDRLFVDPRTLASLDDFFGQWWRLDELPPLNTRVGTPVFDAFAGRDVPTATLHDEMNAEVLELARDVTRRGSDLAELLTSRRFFVRTDALAQLYGQPAWNGDGTPPDFVQPARQGLLTRAAFLATGSANTRPIMKGFRVRNALLCTSLPPPPAGASATPLPLDPDLTTREVVERITEQEGTGCQSCHVRLLNPLGFVTENFDALGRVRNTQRLFDEAGGMLLEKPVSTTVVPHVAGHAERIGEAGEVHQLMVSGGEFQTCFARQYFRFTFQRIEDDTRDGCALKALQDDALAGRPISELVKALALAPAFKRKDLR